MRDLEAGRLDDRLRRAPLGCHACQAVAIVAFIRVGEKLLQHFGPRRPMIWGSLMVVAAVVSVMMTIPTRKHGEG
jgi:hypothetical protein